MLFYLIPRAILSTKCSAETLLSDVLPSLCVGQGSDPKVPGTDHVEKGFGGNVSSYRKQT